MEPIPGGSQGPIRRWSHEDVEEDDPLEDNLQEDFLIDVVDEIVLEGQPRGGWGAHGGSGQDCQ